MGWGDFLRKQAQTPWTEHYLMAGVPGAISTNSPDILQAARASFCPAAVSRPEPRMQWRFWVDPLGTTTAPWPKACFRGLDHLIFAGLDAQNSYLIDLRTRRAIGRFSPMMAGDERRWKTIIFPNLLTLMGSAVGVAGLHCACVVRDGKGILLTGRSGSGKSTLTMALARSGFSFLSDDWTYFSRSGTAIFAWGLIPRLKLLPPAAAFFPELARFESVRSENGEEAFEIDPDACLRIPRSRSCEPREIVILERSPNPEFTLVRIPAAEAAAHLEEDLLAETPEAPHSQLEIIHRLVERGCWRLRYGESPNAVAQKLAGCFS